MRPTGRLPHSTPLPNSPARRGAGPAGVWLVRHGITAWNQEGRLQGWADIGLSAEGRRQAQALKTQISRRHFDGVWASDLSRAIETARILAGEPTTDTRLRELDFGDLEGRGWAELDPPTQEALIEFDGFAAPRGESVEHLRVRVVSFMDQLPPGQHLVVTHAGPFRSVLDVCGVRAHPEPCQIWEIDWRTKEVLSADRPHPSRTW